MDLFSIESSAETGTVVTLAKVLPVGPSPVTEETARQWGRILAGGPSDTVERVRMRSHEMLRSMEVLKHKEKELTHQLTTAEERLRCLEANQAELRDQAARDALTGLMNRREILNVLDRELHRSRRTGKNLGVMMVDLDHFKQLNDTYGHLTGDAALRQFAVRALSAVRPYDCLGRYGGEEFLAVLPECGSAQVVLSVAERLRSAVGGIEMDLDGAVVTVTVSVGATVCDGFSEPQGVVSAADEALYRAKKNGRNRVEFSDIPEAPR